jgi:hypothetical protein
MGRLPYIDRPTEVPNSLLGDGLYIRTADGGSRPSFPSHQLYASSLLGCDGVRMGLHDTQSIREPLRTKGLVPAEPPLISVSPLVSC